jgi:hypothetical protein
MVSSILWISRRDEGVDTSVSINAPDSARIPSCQHVAILLFEKLVNTRVTHDDENRLQQYV